MIFRGTNEVSFQGRHEMYTWLEYLYLFLRMPIWSNATSIDRMWQMYGQFATHRLGTAKEVIATIDECERTFPELQECYHRTSNLVALAQNLPDNQIVGDPRFVSRVFGERLPLGYSVDTAPTGYALERIEGIDYGIMILRKGGSITHGVFTDILRIESHGNTLCS